MERGASRPDGLAFWLRVDPGRAGLYQLPLDDVQALALFAAPRVLEPGKTLVQQGRRPQRVYIIESGEAAMVYATRRERMIVEVLRRGATIGYLEAMLGITSAFEVSARSTVEVLEFAPATISRLIDLHPEMCFRWLKLMAARLERSQRRLVELARKSAADRLIHFLINECDHRRTRSLAMTQGDIAASLAISRQTVSRVLSELEGDGLISRRRGRLVIGDLRRLRNHDPH